MLIAIEGLDACGKGEQVKRLAHRLFEQSQFAVVYKFPNLETLTGSLISQMMKGKLAMQFPEPSQIVSAAPQANALALQCAMIANRMEFAEQIAEHARQGHHVIFDRYVDSGIVYGLADGLPLSWLLQANRYFPQPDIRIWLDISVEESFRRRPERTDAFEANRGRMERVARFYGDWWLNVRHEQGVWLMVDGANSPEEVHEEIWRKLGF